MRYQRFLAALAVALALAPSHALRADGLIRDGVGAISSGRGGTNMGYADNGAIILDNPGAMVNIKPLGFYEANVDTVITDLHYTDQDPNNARGSIRPVPLPELAYIRRSADGDLAIGIGVFAPAGFGANYSMLNPITGPSTRYMSIGALGKILPAAAIRVTDQLSIGGTFGLALSHAELEGPLTVQNGALTGIPTLLDLQATGVAPTGSIGMQYQWTPNTTLGVCFTTESRFNLHGPSSADVFVPNLGVLSSNFDSKVDLVWPRSLAFGIKHDLCPHRRVSADVIWYDWSHAFDQLGMTFTNASNPIVTALAGPVITNNLPMNWHDSVSLRLGYEFEPSAVSTVRMGYVYHDSPAPDSTLNPYTDGVLQHAFSVGYSRRCQKVLLNTAYQYSFGPNRQVGQSDIVGGDFDNSTFSAEAHWISLGVLVPF